MRVWPLLAVFALSPEKNHPGDIPLEGLTDRLAPAMMPLHGGVLAGSEQSQPDCRQRTLAAAMLRLGVRSGMG
jgi:hypothetical protein